MRKVMAAGTLAAVAVMLAASLAGCKSGAKSSASTSVAPVSSAAASSATGSSSAPASSAPASSAAVSSTPASSVPASPLATSSPTLIGSPIVLPSAPTPSPSVAITAISVSVAKVNQPITGGDGGTATFDRPTTHGLSATVDAALRAPATNALAAFENDLKSDPCTDACTPADFDATFAVARSDTSIVSGTWTILTFYPGAANPQTVLMGIIVNATSGSVIAPAQLFTDDDLAPLVTALRPVLEAQLTKIGCNDFGTADYDAATSGTSENYQGVAVTAAGLLVGISDEQVAAHACGSFDEPISWNAVHAGLSAIGLALAAKTALPTGPTAAGRCSVGVLQVAFGAQTQVAADQFQLPVIFTNTASAPCFLQGFPGVDIFGDGGGNLGTISLVRTNAAPARVTISAVSGAHAELTYLKGPDSCDVGGVAWSPAGVNVTPPDATTSIELNWPGNTVDDCQTGATHPGSYIGPVLPGA
jgi:hypothetical protein